MEKKALGRGLSALISSSRQVEDVLKKEIPIGPQNSSTAHANADGGVLFVEISRLTPNRWQPRTAFDEDQLKELVESIKEKGVLQPVLVRSQGDRYEIIAGERRFRAAKLLKIQKVPVVVRDVSDKEALVLSIVENVQRQELNPIEEARAFDRLIKEFSMTQEAVATAVSKDRSTIANLLRLLRLPVEVQKAITSGDLSFGHGKALCALESVPTQIKLTQLVLSKSLSVRELENYISARRSAFPARKKTAKDQDPYVADLERDLQRIFATKVKVLAHKKRGKIQIEYFSDDDRERILKILRRQVTA